MPAKVLTPWPATTPDKRPMVSLSKDGRVRKVGVHILMAKTFIGPKPHAKSQCCHWDGNPYNNLPGNLYWGDNSTNVRDAIRHGTNGQVAKTECPRGHALRPPNLREALFEKHKRRACRACANTVEWARRLRVKGLPPSTGQKREYADRRYNRIMEAA